LDLCVIDCSFSEAAAKNRAAAEEEATTAEETATEAAAAFTETARRSYPSSDRTGDRN
jgi:hypothetical protein